MSIEMRALTVIWDSHNPWQRAALCYRPAPPILGHDTAPVHPNTRTAPTRYNVARAFLTSLGQDAVIDLTDGMLFGWPRWLASFQQNDKVTVIGTGLTNITARPVMGSRWPSFVVTRADGTSVIIWPGPKLTIHECDVLPYSLPFSDRRR